MRSSISTRSLGRALLGAGLFSMALAACSSPGGGGKGAGGGAGANAGCPDDLQFFEANVYKPILSQKCAVCHSQDGLAKGTRMVLAPPSEDGYLEKNFETVKKVAAVDVDGTSVLLLRPSGQHPEGHTGGKVVPFGSPDYQTLETFVARVTQGKDCGEGVASCDKPSPGGRILRRLTRGEYDATIHDLFGIVSTWGAAMTADTVVNGFDNNAGALRVSPLFADQTRRAAEEIAAAVMKSPGSLLPCDPANGDAACAAKLVDSLGKRAFRRPLTADDQARYLALYSGVAQGDGFSVGVETVITAMLQSPHFLYRTEIGGAAPGDGNVPLTQYEIASELSYFLWGTMPDAELFAAADAGMLSTPDAIEKEARRLLADPRSDATIARFVEEWLEIDRLPNIPKDATAYPEFDAVARLALRDETRRFIGHVTREGSGTLTELLTARYSFLTPELAKFYGMPAPAGQADADGFVKVDLSATARAGLLTQGSVVATHSKPASSSPIHRGKLVRERLFCQPLPPPPAGLMVEPPPLDPSLTTRQRYAAHATVEPCQSCHKLIDPIGFGFERFDGIGRQRDTEAGQPIDATGNIVSTPSTDGAFDGTVDLASRLAASPDVHACFALEWFRFAYGVTEDADLSCLVSSVGGDFEKGGLEIDELMVALTRTSHFSERLRDGSESGSTGAGGGGATSTSGAGGGASSSSGGAGGSGPVMPDLAVETMIDSQWASGFQESVKVTNKGAAPITWSITLAVDGKITDLWNATSQPVGAQVQFSGKDFNATLAPGDSASFGFVATK